MASSTVESTNTRLLQAATLLALNVPSMDNRDVLMAVGFTDPENPELKKRLRHSIKSYVQQNGFMILEKTDDAMVHRSILIYNLMKKNPDKPNSKALVKLTDTMRLAGFDKHKARSGTSEYMRAFRLIKAELEQSSQQELPPTPALIRHRRPPIVSVPAEPSPCCHDELSPLSADNTDDTFGNQTQASSSQSVTVLPDDFESNYYVWPLTYLDGEDTSDTKSITSGATFISLPSRSKPVSLQALTTTKKVRLTSQAAHQERQFIAEGQAIRSAIYKSATIFWEGVVSNHNTLKRFDSSDKVATAFNRLAGIELITGHELESAIKTNNVAMSPKRRGRSFL